MPYEDLMVAMQRATFCLMPPGETASSRRLTDAVLAGCLPVFIGPPWHEMPLAGPLNYSAFAVFVTAPQPRLARSSTRALYRLGMMSSLLPLLLLGACFPALPSSVDLPNATSIPQRQLVMRCSVLYGGMGVGLWNSLKESPYNASTHIYDPLFWFSRVNVSEVAMHIEDLAHLPGKLRALPDKAVQRMQAALHKAQPLFRYRSARLPISSAF